jgi:hypothetical protein
MKKLMAYLFLGSFIGILALQLQVHHHQNEHCSEDHKGKSVVHENHVELESCLWCLKNIATTYLPVAQLGKSDFPQLNQHLTGWKLNITSDQVAYPTGRGPPSC